jgi:hypothetical protein
MAWPLIESLRSSQVRDDIIQKLLNESTFKSSASFLLMIEKITLVSACVLFLLFCLLIPSQQLTGDLVTNILLLIHETHWIWHYPPRHRACRNRHTQVPEGPWRAGLVAALRGWTSRRPNVQPATPVTSHVKWRLQSDLMCSWLQAADLQHMAVSLSLTFLKALFFCLYIRTG